MRWQNGGSVCWKQNCNWTRNLLHFTFLLPSNALKDIWGLYGAPNQIIWRRDCCFWKAVLIAKYPVKMQNSSQTKDLIKDHFSFTAFFLQPLQYMVSSMVLQSPVALSLLDVVIFIECSDIVPWTQSSSQHQVWFTGWCFFFCHEIGQ